MEEASLGLTPEQLSQQKDEILSKLREQNEALGGKAMRFLKREDGGEFVIFAQPTAAIERNYYGGFDGGAILVSKNKAGYLLHCSDGETVEEVQSAHSGSLEITRVDNDVNFQNWNSSLMESEKWAADGLKRAQADVHYTPRVLDAVTSMPKVLKEQSGFDIEAPQSDLPS